MAGDSLGEEGVSPTKSLRSGMKVRVHGLQSAAGAKLNGTVGQCLEFNGSSGRWGVRLSDGTSKALKPENLAVVCEDSSKTRQAPKQAPQVPSGKLNGTGQVEVKATTRESASRRPGPVNLQAAKSKMLKAEEFQATEDYNTAIDLYNQALADVWTPGEALASGDVMNLVRNVIERKSFCHGARDEWFECLLLIQRVRQDCQQLLHGPALMLEACAFGEIGLMENAARALDELAAADLDADFLEDVAQMARSTNARRHAVEHAGHEDVLKEEIAKLRRALPEKNARQWQEAIVHKCQSKDGQEECIANGFLLREWLGEPQTHFTLRAMHKALLFQVKKKLQNMSLSQQVDFASPESLRCGRSAVMLKEGHWQELRKKGLVVVDDLFDTAAMQAAWEECEVIKKAGLMKKDPDDLCNPGSRSIDIMFTGREAKLKEEEAPVLREVMACMRGLAIHCEEKLGLSLRVPQTMMLSCYGPGAYYRRHMDSYDGKDIPRKVTILLYTNPHWEAADEGCLRAWVGGKPTDYSPLAGRLIMFMSQDIPHEVLESKKDRYCITQWIWDVKKDDFGR